MLAQIDLICGYNNIITFMVTILREKAWSKPVNTVENIFNGFHAKLLVGGVNQMSLGCWDKNFAVSQMLFLAISESLLFTVSFETLHMFMRAHGYLRSRHEGAYKMHVELHSKRNISYYLVYCLHVNAVIGRLLLVATYFEKRQDFFPSIPWLPRESVPRRLMKCEVWKLPEMGWVK